MDGELEDVTYVGSAAVNNNLSVKLGNTEFGNSFATDGLFDDAGIWAGPQNLRYNNCTQAITRLTLGPQVQRKQILP